jgi:hypothetical protein
MLVVEVEETECMGMYVHLSLQECRKNRIIKILNKSFKQKHVEVTVVNKNHINEEVVRR